MVTRGAGPASKGSRPKVRRDFSAAEWGFPCEDQGLDLDPESRASEPRKVAHITNIQL